VNGIGLKPAEAELKLRVAELKLRAGVWTFP
jgi:hypothetical protein